MSKKNNFATMDLITAYEKNKNNPELIKISEIEPNPNQPRVFEKDKVKDLTDSMSHLGLIEPIIIRKKGHKYIIVAGERRYHAAISLGWKDIPSIITDADDDISYEMALAENEKRKSLNPWEVGKAIQHLRKERKKTAEEVALLLGYTERYVKKLSSIARLDHKSVQELINTGKDVSVKNLENLLREKEDRTRGGDMSSPLPHSGKIVDKVVMDISKLSAKNKDLFLKELYLLKKKYGVL